ncbi:mitochondrial outer membrane protein porin of 36 kDa isoform X1 [Vitis vinifera]|uniref:Mitochondrial outer membrane protein porin of 36 kDa n=1 Tax=Vitis vinifera TaxID=29760 RepID=D7SIG0_VITVI|eukprot:XP_003634314.2 PREDICTED: mitochondrial outer membrane protein porin of 36 kDa isoform X1 [Vitis vinifera]
MAYRPSFYLEIGRKARDLLYRDYTEQPPMHYHYGCCDWSYDLALRSQICRSTSHEINDNNQELVGEHVPGISAVLRFIVPDPLSSKVELRYLRDFLGITAGIEGMTTNPVMSFSGVIGSSVVSLGTDLAFDTILKNFTKCNAGLSFSSPIVSASLTLEDKGDTAKASCFGLINPLTSTAIAAELKHTFSQNETSLTLGAQHEVAPLTVIKARADTTGKVGALFQHQLVSKIFLTLAGDVDIQELKTSPTIGLSLALRP